MGRIDLHCAVSDSHLPGYSFNTRQSHTKLMINLKFYVECVDNHYRTSVHSLTVVPHMQNVV